MVVVTTTDDKKPHPQTTLPTGTRYTVSIPRAQQLKVSISFAGVVNNDDRSIQQTLLHSVDDLGIAILELKKTIDHFETALEPQADILSEALEEIWDDENTLHGFFKFEVILKETGILTADTIAHIPDRLSRIKDGVEPAFTATAPHSTDKLQTYFYSAIKNIKQLKTIIDQSHTIDDTQDIQKALTATNETAQALKKINTLLRSEPAFSHTDPAKIDFQKTLPKKSLLDRLIKYADMLGETDIATTIRQIKSTIYTTGNNEINIDSLVEKTTQLGSLLLSIDKPSKQSDKISITDKLKIYLNQFDTWATPNIAVLIMRDKLITNAYSVEQKASNATAVEIRKKYKTLSQLPLKLAEIEKLLDGLANIAGRIAAGNTDPQDLWKVRALERVISARLTGTYGPYMQPVVRSFLTDLRGDYAYVHTNFDYNTTVNSFGNLGLGDLPNNKLAIKEQLALGNNHFLSGIILAGASLINTLERLKARK